MQINSPLFRQLAGQNPHEIHKQMNQIKLSIMVNLTCKLKISRFFKETSVAKELLIEILRL